MMDNRMIPIVGSEKEFHYLNHFVLFCQDISPFGRAFPGFAHRASDRRMRLRLVLCRAEVEAEVACRPACRKLFRSIDFIPESAKVA